MARSIFIFFILLLHIEVNAQLDSVVKAKFDSIKNIGNDIVEENTETEKTYTAVADSTAIQERDFDAKKIETLRKDRDLQYKEPPTIAESLWDRILSWIGEFISRLLQASVSTNWGRVAIYTVVIIILVVIVLMLLKVNALKLFYSAQDKSMAYAVLEENIHEMDFEKLIQEAMKEGDYRKGVRLTFLYALKILSDKNHIHWQSGKTNHDYVKELSTTELKTGFNELNYYFEYAWYGNFSITQDMFKKVQNVFTQWKGMVR